jgi:hypothetical protein
MATPQPSLFGGLGTPEEMQNALMEQKAVQFAGLTPDQQLSMMGYKGGAALGRGLAGAFGVQVQDPVVQRATRLRQLASQYNTNTAQGLRDMAAALQATDPETSAQILYKANEMETQAAQLRSSQAEAQKKELSVQQEAALRNELANLGPDATQEDILKAVTKYGAPDKILAVLQSAADKATQREQAIQMQRERLDAQMEAAKERGATAKEIAQMRIDSNQIIAGMMAGIRQQTLDDKKAEKQAKEDAQKQGVVASFDSALDTLNRIATHPGKSTAVGFGGTTASMIPGTNAAGFASQLETFKAQVFLPQVQNLKGMGALSDAEGKRLTAAIGALDQKMKPAEFDSQLAIIKNDLNKARARVTGAPMPSAAVAGKAGATTKGTKYTIIED